jgi:CubicO group peptidase (beta-lactamase class C family)
MPWEMSRLELGVTKAIAERGVPDPSVATVSRGGIVHTAAFCVRSGLTNELITDRTVFEAASLSKPVFSHAMLPLVDAGVRGLDRRFSGWVISRTSVDRLARPGEVGPISVSRQS